MLLMESVSKKYHHRSGTVSALDDVTLEVKQGEFVAVVGPSGSGKSTLLLLLGGMLSPEDGRVWMDGKSLYELDAEERARTRGQKVGFVFQTFNLIPYLTALENVQVPLLLSGFDSDSQREKAATSLVRVGLGDRLDHKPNELSVGQQQRVALARMLANDPAFILADEPTGNLDPESSSSVMDFLAELNAEGRTIIIVTHDPNVARRAKRTLRIVEGTLREDHVREALQVIG